METENISAAEIIKNMQAAAFEFMQTFETFDETKINKVPFENSWTAAQVGEHVIKSNGWILQSLNESGNFARKPHEKLKELDAVLLNFNHTLQSPELIVPEQKSYDKKTVAEDLKNSFELINAVADKINLNEIIQQQAIGEISKLELIHFVEVHSKRHTRQLQKIYKTIV